jgi:glycerol-3-phosphate dehydrogenase
MNKPIPTVIPATSFFQMAYYYLGCLMYHGIYWVCSDPKAQVSFDLPTVIGRDELYAKFPFIDRSNIYGVVYPDGQMNDSRLNLDILLSGTVPDYSPGSVAGNLLNYARFQEFIKDENGKIVGARVLDKINNKTIEVDCKVVVNCTGVFADTLRKLDDNNVEERIVPVEGTHVVLPPNFANKKYGLLIPKTTDGRVLFILPWLKNALVGTTDVKFDKPVIDPPVSIEDMTFIVKEVSRIYPSLEPTDISSNIKARWAGLRPLVKELTPPESAEQVKAAQGKIGSVKKGATKNIARKHVIERVPSGEWNCLCLFCSSLCLSVKDSFLSWGESGPFTGIWEKKLLMKFSSSSKVNRSSFLLFRYCYGRRERVQG